MNSNQMDDNIDQQAGRSMLDATGPSGSMDLINPGLAGKVARLFTGGSGGTTRKTSELVTEGLQAKVADEVLSPDQAAELSRVADELNPQPVTPEVPDTVQHSALDPVDPAVPTEPVEPPMGVDPDEFAADVAAKQQEELERRTWERNINLDYVERPEDLGAILEVNAEQIPTADRQTFGEVEVGAETVDMSKVFSGPADQALNSQQLLAGRQMLITMTDHLKQVTDKVLDGTATTQDKANFTKLQTQTVMLQKFMQGKVREAGRALNSMKIVARAVNNRDLEAVSELTAGGGIDIQARILQEQFQRGGDPVDVLNTVDQMGPINKRVAALANFWTASILTSPNTQIVNATSNGMFQLVDGLALRPIAAVISPIRRKMTGDKAGAEAVEVGSTVLAWHQGLRDAMMMSGRVLGEGVKRGEYVSSFGGRKVDEITRDEMRMSEIIPGMDKVPVLSHLANLAQRATEAGSYGLLTAGDEFFKAMAYRSSLYRQANRQALQEGLTGIDASTRANEILNDVTQPMNETALRDSERLTFTNEVGGLMGEMAKSAQAWTQGFPALRFIAPFIKTPVALLDRTIKMSPLAPLQKEFRETIAKGGAEADVALAELTFGTMIFTGAALLHQGEMLTGAGPDNPKQRAALERLGWQRNSIKVGGTYVAYNRGFDPLGMSVGAMANMLDIVAYQQKEADAADYTAGTIFAIAKYFKDSTYMQGFGELLALIDGNRDPEKWAARNLASFIPSALRDIEKLRRGEEMGSNPVYPGADFWEYFNAYLDQRTPGSFGAEEAPPRRYWDGTIVTAGGGEAVYIYNTLSPVKLSFGREDAASERLVANGVMVGAPSSTIPMMSSMRISPDLMDLDGGYNLYDRLIELVGQQRKIMIDATVKNRQFKKLDSGPGSDQSIELEKALQKGMTNGKLMFLQEIIDNPPTVEKYGPNAVMFNIRDLKQLVKKLKRKDLSPEQASQLQAAGTRGVSTKNELWVPDI